MTAQQVKSSNGNPALQQILAKHIRSHPQQRLTFAEFMDQVLYHPDHGYYSTQPVKIGATGDFVTSPHLGADFGELLGDQFADMWNILDRPIPFTLVEMGAGQGLLVKDLVRHLRHQHPDFFQALEYVIVEKSPALIQEQHQRLAAIANTWGKLSWRTWEEISPDSITGCCFSNELVDAFPVHQVVLTEGELQEVYVTVTDGSPEDSPQFVEILGELSTPQIVEYLTLSGVNLLTPAYRDGYRTEVNLAALDWLSTVSDRLHRGYLLTIDYGYPANRYYSPARSEGTLQCYYQHAHHSDPYCHIGHQDLTAHVNFTALERYGDRWGLQIVGYTQQGLFLMALGLGDRIFALSQPDSFLTPQTILRRRDALHALINPMGLGNFGVLIQQKGLSPSELGRSLKGLTLPS